MLHSIHQQIWKTQQWPQDWKRSVFIPIPKKGNVKECSNYCTVALISHASKVMLKIIQARLQQTCTMNSLMFKLVLGRITTNKASGGDGIPAELFQILKDDAVKVLHSICQQIWKTQQWPQDRKRSVFIPIPKKDNAKKCSNYCTIALISHTSSKSYKVGISSR